MSKVDWSKFETTDDLMTDTSWPEKGQDLEVGDSVQGRYVGKKENIGKNKSNVYVIEQQDGSKVGVWGSTVIDARFETIAVGKMVAIEYVGEKTGKKSGSTYKDFKVGQGIVAVGDEGK
jgi:hypothetical protein